MIVLPDDPMAVLAATHDVFLAKIPANDPAGTRRPYFYVCESGGDCGCLFWPDVEGGGDVWPDRLVMDNGSLPAGQARCEDNECGCHRFPRHTWNEEHDGFVVDRATEDAADTEETP